MRTVSMKPHKLFSFITGIYALIVMTGGIIGFIMAGSFPSLIAGVVFGLILLVSARVSAGGLPVSRYITLTVMGFLLCFFAYRYFSTGNFMPSGAFSALTALVVGVLAFIPAPRTSPMHVSAVRSKGRLK